MYYKCQWALCNLYLRTVLICLFLCNHFHLFILRSKTARKKVNRSKLRYLEKMLISMTLPFICIYLLLFFFSLFTPFIRPAAWRRSDRRNKASATEKTPVRKWWFVKDNSFLFFSMLQVPFVCYKFVSCDHWTVCIFDLIYFRRSSSFRLV